LQDVADAGLVYCKHHRVSCTAIQQKQPNVLEQFLICFVRHCGLSCVAMVICTCNQHLERKRISGAHFGFFPVLFILPGRTFVADAHEQGEANRQQSISTVFFSSCPRCQCYQATSNAGEEALSRHITAAHFRCKGWAVKPRNRHQRRRCLVSKRQTSLNPKWRFLVDRLFGDVSVEPMLAGDARVVAGAVRRVARDNLFRGGWRASVYEAGRTR